MIVKRAAIFMGNSFLQMHFFRHFGENAERVADFLGREVDQRKKTWYD
jgi:hypothetical protein